MTEAELRDKVAQCARSYVGTTEHSVRHKEILSIFNSKSAYQISEYEPWCAAFAGAIAISSGIDQYVPINASCSGMIAGFKNMGEWVEDDAYRPGVGDYLFFIWSSKHSGFVDVEDNLEDPDHVGIVVATSASAMTIVDGNNSKDMVGTREVAYNSSVIRGFGTPKYSEMAREKKLQVKVDKDALEDVLNLYSSSTRRARDRGMWLRSYELTAGLQGQPLTGFTIGNGTDPMHPPLHIAFSVEKANLTAPNNTTLKIWNLGKAKRAFLDTPGAYVMLKAGYWGRNALIAEGQVLWCIDDLESGNLVTEVEMEDIGRGQIRDSYIAISYATEINGLKIIDDIISQMGISKAGVYISPKAQFHTYQKGFSFVGTAYDALKQVCEDQGLLCTILNGMIDIRAPYEPRTLSAVVLNAQTGLLGVPKKMMELEDGDTMLAGWRVEFLLNNSIDLGSYIRLESKFIPGGFGYYCVEKLSITGDNYSGDWKCSATLSDPLYGLQDALEEPLYDPDAYTHRSGTF